MTACISSGAGAGPQDEATAVEPEPVLGETTPEELLSTLPGWVDELVRSQPDQEAAERLIRMAPGVEVEVFFGSWCSDSRRELTRLWRALELVGGESGFPVSYIGVDRSKTDLRNASPGVRFSMCRR